LKPYSANEAATIYIEWSSKLMPADAAGSSARSTGIIADPAQRSSHRQAERSEIDLQASFPCFHQGQGMYNRERSSAASF
jgi:hypothetical protein